MAKARTAYAAPTADTRIMLLLGEEDMLKKETLEKLRQALTEKFGELQFSVFNGETVPLADVLDELRTYSLMQAHKLVLVDEAAEFAKRFREQLERYAEAPVEHGTLVLRGDEWHPGKLDKLIAKVGLVVKCEALKPDAAKNWVVRRAKAVHQIVIEADAAQLMVQRLGTGLTLLDTELGKAALYVAPGAPITEDIVLQSVGRSSEEAAWAVQEAVLAALDPGTLSTSRQRASDMLHKIHELIDLAGQDVVPVSFAVADLMRKITLGAALKRQGVSGFNLTREMGVWKGADAFLNVVAQTDPRRAATWFEKAVACQRRSRTGLGNPMQNLECFLVELADETTAGR